MKYVYIMSNNARKDYMSWNDTFMNTAILFSKRSKDPSTQVGCCIVDELNRVVGIGYNGFPRNCSDSDFPWSREGVDNKYLYVVHAEQNAILNSTMFSLNNCTLYTTLFPCNKCTQSIIQKGISKVIYLDNKYNDKIEFIASKKMLLSADVKLVKYNVGQRQRQPYLITDADADADDDDVNDYLCCCFMYVCVMLLIYLLSIFINKFLNAF